MADSSSFDSAPSLGTTTCPKIQKKKKKEKETPHTKKPTKQQQQKHRIGSPEVDSHIHGQLIYQKKPRLFSGQKTISSKNGVGGVPMVAQWLTNLTGNHEVTGLVPGLAQWVKDLVLL